MIDHTLSRWGRLLCRYGLVVVLAWIGFGKYVKMEARVLIQHSPLMSWLYDISSVAFVARALGTMEIVAALLIALRPRWPWVSALPGQFPLKDLVLLGVAFWTLGDSLGARRASP